MRRSQRRRGQALIEFAVVLPVVILVFYAIFDTSRLLFYQVSMESSAQAAARILSLNRAETTRGDVYREVLRHAPGVLLPNDGLQYQRIQGPTGEPCVEVRLVARFPLLSGFYLTRSHHITLGARARAPLDVRSSGGKVHLP